MRVEYHSHVINVNMLMLVCVWPHLPSANRSKRSYQTFSLVGKNIMEIVCKNIGTSELEGGEYERM